LGLDALLNGPKYSAMNLYLDHAEFVRALDAREIKVLMSRREALSICDRFPQVFGSTTMMKGCGCALWIIVLVMPWWIDLPWYGWLGCWGGAFALNISVYNAMTQTAIDAVIRHAKEDEVFYASLIQQNALLVRPR
jgi:hypothetical protein